MADKINKKTPAEKKSCSKLKPTSPNRKLNESLVTVVGSSRQQVHSSHRVEPSQARRQMAEAALARLNSQRKDTAFNTSLAAIRAQVRKELEAEKKAEESATESTPPKRRSLEKKTSLEVSPHLAVKGVYFRCPMISKELLTGEEWKIKIKEFLFEQLKEERGLTACRIIRSCNYNPTKVTDCVDILCKYLGNIIANPTESRFHKIRCSNAAFNDKVFPILGARELLYAAGFRQKKLEHNGVEENFLVFEEQNIEAITTLELLRDALKSEAKIELEIDRNVQVLFPAQAVTRVDLPQDFYSLSPEDLKREQQLRAETLEKQMQLRTRAIREKNQQPKSRKYKFALIRVRFPDGLYLQGTFSAYEKFSDIVKFVMDNLENKNVPFFLTSPLGHKFEETDKDSTLFNLKLVPTTILTFQWEPSVAKQMAKIKKPYLKPTIVCGKGR